MAGDSVKLRIVSDGTSRGTRVETEDGVLIRGVQRVEWSCELNDIATATIVVRRIDVNVEGVMP